MADKQPIPRQDLLIMANQMILRGSCFATPPGHARATFLGCAGAQQATPQVERS